MLHSVVSDLGLHCLTILGVSRLKWVKASCKMQQIAFYFILFYYYFYREKRLVISCESSARQTIHMICQALFSLKSTTKIKMSSAAVVISTLQVTLKCFNPFMPSVP